MLACTMLNQIMTNNGTMKLPTEQHVLRAITHWQLNSELCSGPEACSPGNCVCCDTVRELLGNAPLMELVSSVVRQLEGGEANPVDALLSLYAFGFTTARVMDGDAGENRNRRVI